MRLLQRLIPLGLLGMAATAATLPPGLLRGGLYDPATEVTLQGRVEQVTPGEPASNMGVHLMVESEGILTEVALGPADFLKSKGFVFAKGDMVEVTGSRVALEENFVIAREITRAGKTLTLRDKKGIPMWAIQRIRPRPVY